LGGRLRFEGTCGPHRFFVNINADGTYHARLRRGSDYRVSVQRLYVGRARVPGSEFEVEPAALTVPLDGPAPQPDLRIAGRGGEHVVVVQVCTRNGAKVPGARVELTGIDGRNRFRVPLGAEKTDGQGSARFTGLPRGRARVRLVDSGPFARSVQNLGTRRETTAFTDEIVVGGRGPARTTFELLDAGVLQVTVDAHRRKQPPLVSVWTTDAELVAGPRARPDVGGSSAVYRFESLPPGRYRVVAHHADGRSVFRETDVRAGQVTPLLLTRAKAVGSSFEVVVHWERFPDDVRRARFYLTGLTGRFSTSVYEAARGGAVRRTYGAPPRESAYLLRYPALGLARRIAPSAKSGWVIDFTPPKPGFLSRGGRCVTVRLTRDGKPVHDLFVGLRVPAKSRAPRADWMRYAGSRDGVVRFDDVPTGFYELHLIDRVLGEDHGLAARVRKLGVSREDVSIDWELGVLADRAR
jgi:hypothetical protein